MAHFCARRCFTARPARSTTFAPRRRRGTGSRADAAGHRAHLRRGAGAEGRQPRRAARRDPRGDRAERRRQVVAGQHHQRALPRRRGQHPDRRQELSPGARAPAGGARRRADLPEPRAVSPPLGAGQHRQRTGPHPQRRDRRPGARPAAAPGARTPRSARGSPRSRRCCISSRISTARPASCPTGCRSGSSSPAPWWREPELLLLDEPMAGMTATEKAEMAGFLRLARAERPFSVILIEHDIGVVMDLSDRVAVLDYGRKIADGTPDEVRARSRGHPAPISAPRPPDGLVRLPLPGRGAGRRPALGRDVLAGRDRLRADLQDLGRAELRPGRDGALRGADLRQPGGARVPLRRRARRHAGGDGAARLRHRAHRAAGRWSTARR